MLFFGKRDEAQGLAKKARRYTDPSQAEFDFGQGVECLKQAVDLKPDETRYREELALAYLKAAELAVTCGARPGWRLERSAELALQEYDRAYEMSGTRGERAAKAPPVGAALFASLCLGDEKGAADRLRSWCSRRSGMEPRGENLDLTVRTIQAGVTRGKIEGEPLHSRITAEELHMFLTMAVDFLANVGAREPEEFARLAEEVGWVELVNSMEATLPGPGEARTHLERAATHGKQGSRKDAEAELETAAELAPDIAWLCRTMCELGGR